MFGNGVDNLSNFIALPKGFHEKKVTPAWNAFSRAYPNATQAQVYQFAKALDKSLAKYANNIEAIIRYNK
jgi:hypothetical protein